MRRRGQVRVRRKKAGRGGRQAGVLAKQGQTGVRGTRVWKAGVRGRGVLGRGCNDALEGSP